MSEKKELKKLSEIINDMPNKIDKIRDNLGAYMWILPGVLALILFGFNIEIMVLKIFIWLIFIAITCFIFYYTKTHITVIKSLKDNYSNFFINKWFPQYMFENDENKEKKNNTSKVSNIVASVIYYLICLIPLVLSLLLIMWAIRIARYKLMRRNCR